jgi:glutamine amidotransferase
MVTVIDYGMGNLGSIINMLRKVNANAQVSSKKEDIQNADKLILPGVGAFDRGMTELQQRGLIPVIKEAVFDGRKPLLGICLGMQLLTKESEEGRLPGLGIIDAKTIRFQLPNDNSLRIPHMGWNTITTNKDHYLFRDFNGYEEPRFYFVHEYHVVCANDAEILTHTNYGYDYASAIQKDNIIGVQFHPEKSHKFGMHFFRNFTHT